MLREKPLENNVSVLWLNDLPRNVERKPPRKQCVCFVLFLQAKEKKADEIDKHIDAPLHMEVALCTDRWCVIYLNCCAQFNLNCCFVKAGLGQRNETIAVF